MISPLLGNGDVGWSKMHRFHRHRTHSRLGGGDSDKSNLCDKTLRRNVGLWSSGKEPLPNYLMGGCALTPSLRPEESDAALGGSQAKDTAKTWSKRQPGTREKNMTLWLEFGAGGTVWWCRGLCGPMADPWTG